MEKTTSNYGGFLHTIKRSQWTTRESGPLAHAKPANSSDFRQKQRSQWTTRESGPLAHAKRSNTPDFRQKQRSQWSTLASGPLAQSKTALSPEFRQKQRSQWTTRASVPLAHAKRSNTPGSSDFDYFLQVTSPQARPSPKVRAFQSLSFAKATRR